MKYFIDYLNEIKNEKIYPVYLFYGPESYLREKALLLLKEYLLPSDGQELNYQVLDGAKVSGQEIVSAARDSAFISGQRITIVRNTVLFQSRTGSKVDDDKIIVEYIANPVLDSCLVLETAENVDRRKKIFKETARVGRVVEFSRLKAADLLKWLSKTAREEGCNLDREAAEELLTRCGNEMFVLYNEVRKLAIYTGGGKAIGVKAVRELVTGNVDENVFEVVDAIGKKDCIRALSGIQNLLMQKQQPPQIIGMVARQLRLILQVRGLVEAGLAREEIISSLKLHPFVYRKIYQQRNNFNLQQLINSLNTLADLDYSIKTGRAAFYPSIENLIVKICAQK